MRVESESKERARNYRTGKDRRLNRVFPYIKINRMPGQAGRRVRSEHNLSNGII